MFASKKNFFADVSCPFQEKCMLPGCIFGHPESLITRAEAEAGVTSEDHTLNPEDGLTKQGEQQSGLGRSVSSGPLPLQENRRPGISKPQPALNNLEGKPKQQVLKTNEESSPAPLRRKGLNGSTIPVKPSLTQTHSSAPSSPKPPAKSEPKKEGLNPRALKGAAPGKHEFRFRLVQALHEHFARLNSELAKDANDLEKKLVLSDQELITKALDIEENAATVQPTIYQNVVKNSILKYKKMTVGQWKEERDEDVKRAAKAAAEVILSDTPVSKPPAPPKTIETGLTSTEELELLQRLYTPISGLSKHGYVISVPTDQEIEMAKEGVAAAQGWEVCDRCKSRFQVFPERREEDGALSSGGACTYHYGKPYWQDRSATDPKAKREKKYRCCGQSMGDSPGCTQAESHVFKISEVKRMASILNFEETPPNIEKVSDRPVCIDGEMGYTVYGLELLRLTATSWPNGEELFDVLVRPLGPILDLNSRYSGVWPKDMAEAIPWTDVSESESSTDGPRKLRIVDSPAAARALLFSHLSPLTPLIGHGLENDLNSIRVIHPTIIDTALLYPHKAGLPYRNGLKMLMHTHLSRHIQVVVDGKMDGHDSKEDANAAGDLVRYALANEWQKMKREGWILENGIFKGPSPREPPPNAPTGPSGRKRSRDEMEVEDGELDG